MKYVPTEAMSKTEKLAILFGIPMVVAISWIVQIIYLGTKEDCTAYLEDHHLAFVLGKLLTAHFVLIPLYILMAIAGITIRKRGLRQFRIAIINSALAVAATGASVVFNLMLYP